MRQQLVCFLLDLCLALFFRRTTVFPSLPLRRRLWGGTVEEKLASLSDRAGFFVEWWPQLWTMCAFGHEAYSSQVPSTPTWKGRVYSGGGKPLLPVPFSLAASGSSHPTAALLSPSSHSFVHYFFFCFRVIRSVRYTLGTIRQVLLIKNKMCSPQLTLSSQSKRRNRHVHKDFPGGPVAKTLRSQCKTAWVPSLVRDLDTTCMPQLRPSTAK